MLENSANSKITPVKYMLCNEMPLSKKGLGHTPGFAGVDLDVGFTVVLSTGTGSTGPVSTNGQREQLMVFFKDSAIMSA